LEHGSAGVETVLSRKAYFGTVRSRMQRHILPLFLFLGCMARAQYVIPDAQLATRLQ
jgi:hypothetical protein